MNAGLLILGSLFGLHRSMPRQINGRRSRRASGAVVIACLVATSAAAQTAREVHGAAAVEPLQDEPPAKIIVDPPLTDPLSRGRVVIQYRTENLHIVPVFGSAALAVSPRVRHIHVSVDDSRWVWADASRAPVIVNGLPPGPHKILLQLETPNHQLLHQGAVTFTVPKAALAAAAAEASDKTRRATTAPSNEPPAEIVIDQPLPEPLSRGVARR